MSNSNSLRLAAALSLATTLVLAGPLRAQPPAQCPDAAIAADLGAPLPRLANRLAAHRPIVIVALGSSSTAGAGASAPERSYPSDLQRELSRLWPQQRVVVVNRGVNGEEAADMYRRLARDVFAEHPDLVVWQLGTNYLMRNEGVGSFAATIGDGIDAIRAQGTDVVLMDPQYAPKVLRDPDAGAMVELIGDLAHARHVGLFRRFDLMSGWIRQDALSFADVVAPDGLHMNDWSYNCVALSLAAALDRAARNSLVGRADSAD
jgi:lysophospholipase L1-like esterase